MHITHKLITPSVVQGFIGVLYRLAIHAKAGTQATVGNVFIVSNLQNGGPIGGLHFDGASLVVKTYSDETMFEVTGSDGMHTIHIPEKHAETVLMMMTNYSISVYKPRKVSEFGIGLVNATGGIEFCAGDLTIHHNAVIECADQPVRTLDHTANRRMLKELKALFDQVMIKAKLGVFSADFLNTEGARVYNACAGNAYDTTINPKGLPSLESALPNGYGTKLQNNISLAFADICAKFLDTGVLDPDDSIRIALLVVKRRGYMIYLSNYKDRFTRDFPVWLPSELNRLIESAKEPLRIATGVVTFK